MTDDKHSALFAITILKRLGETSTSKKVKKPLNVDSPRLAVIKRKGSTY